MMSPLQLPVEVWLQVFSFLSWGDKLSLRATCSHFRHLLDEAPSLWRGFSVLLHRLSRYDRIFWRSLAQRNVSSVSLRAGSSTDLKLLRTWLPGLTALRLDGWRGRSIQELKLRHLQRMSITSCTAQLKNLDFLVPLNKQLTHLSLCNVQLTCPAAHLLTAIGHLTRLKSLQLHHDGALRIPTLSGLLGHLTTLTHLSFTMVTYKTLSPDFFSPAHLPDGGALKLSDLHLLNYDAVVTQEVLQPLAHLRSLSVLHLYSVPGPICHLRTWLTSLPHLCSLSVHGSSVVVLNPPDESEPTDEDHQELPIVGGHPLVAYADLLPSSLSSLTLCVDLQPEDLHMVSLRAPHLEHLHLEPWGTSSNLIRLLPQLFPHLRMLAIRHHHVSDEDFLYLKQLQHLHTLEVLDPFYRPDPRDPSWVVQEPSPRLQELIQTLQELTGHRVRVISTSRRDSLSCSCI